MTATGWRPRSTWVERGWPSFVHAAALIALLASPRLARACDLCAIYTSTEGREMQTGLRLGVAEQYTDFGTLKLNSETVPNPFGEFLHSSITQVFAGYQFLPRAGAQLNLPVIVRSFQRVQSGGIEDGTVDGIGDLSLIGNVHALSYVDTVSVAHLIFFGGLKFPTGDPALLSEEVDPPPCIPFPDPTSCGGRLVRLPVGSRPHHQTGPPSGIHGHDLALGSGSVDGIVGAQAFGSWQRAYATAAVQYIARTVGAFGYQYANDLLFETGPGAYLLLGDDWFGEAYALGAQVVFSGETKGNDTIDGTKEDDTAVTALYLGPAVQFTWGTHLSTEIGADLPVLQHNTGLQSVPDYRLRGGITWRF